MADQTSKQKVYEDGELWSFIRRCMSQGKDIHLDHVERTYEEYSARLDLAALERLPELQAYIVRAVTAQRGAVETSGQFWASEWLDANNGAASKEWRDGWDACLVANKIPLTTRTESLLRPPSTQAPSGCHCTTHCAAPVVMGKQTPCRDPAKAARFSVETSDLTSRGSHKAAEVSQPAVSERQPPVEIWPGCLENGTGYHRPNTDGKCSDCGAKRPEKASGDPHKAVCEGGTGGKCTQPDCGLCCPDPADNIPEAL